jgi:arylsulfatase
MLKKFLFILLIAIASCNSPRQKKKAENARPNILIIVADDLGYSDIQPFGGNIATPILNRLAKEAVLFSNFHVQPTCSPSRSSLLTGNDNHVAGFGIMSEMDYPALHSQQLPGYLARLTNQVVTIPEILQNNGYHTYMTGKWHLGEGKGGDPHDRGFEQSFILTTGGGSNWNDKKALSPLQHMIYTRNGNEVPLPNDFYSSKNYTDSLLQFIDRDKADKKPFFAYLAYTAVHDPLHVPKEYIQKYRGKFDMGWDSLWAIRFTNLKTLGIVPKDAKGFINPAIPKWNSLPKEKREQLAREMEVYAGMLEYMDMSIGRVLDYLKKEGMYDNTMIIFMGDNGANGAMATAYPGNEDGKYLSTFNNSSDNLGSLNSFPEVGPGWAQATTSPFRFFKSFASEGGIRAPLIVKMPGRETNGGRWSKTFVHVTDIMPTVLELTGASYPKQSNGKDIHELIGKSMLPVLNGSATVVHANDGMGWELFEMKAFIKGNWKLLRLPQPFGPGQWQLYDLDKDPGETNDLSTQYPDVKKQLIEEWNDYAKRNDVYDHKGHYDSLYRANFRPDNDDD